jgi:hypothetical protein
VALPADPRTFVVVFIVGCICAIGIDRASAQTSVSDAVIPPANLTVAAVFGPALDHMLRLSPTFRRQCRRLAAATNVIVVIQLEELQRRPSFYARTTFAHGNHDELIAADVFLQSPANAAELIAHEIEHVLEQLDGVDLEAQLGSGNVWKREDGAFETRRAIEVGRRVAREIKQKSNARLSK